jgi:hypothetical protein
MEAWVTKVIERKRSEEEEDPNKPRFYRSTGKTVALDEYLLFPKGCSIEIACVDCGRTMMNEHPAFWKTDLDSMSYMRKRGVLAVALAGQQAWFLSCLRQIYLG